MNQPEIKPPLAWRPDFATGVAIIDDQHRELIKMLNQASTQLTDHSPLSDVARIVQGLLSYAGYHFQTEEKLMAEHGYAQHRAAPAAEHIRAHRAFAEKVVAVKAQIDAGQRIAKADLESFLSNWLTDHILHTDKELGAFIRDQQNRAKTVHN
ncbi:MAG: bacteriohemerythrin [Sterolibacterium sp.]